MRSEKKGQCWIAEDDSLNEAVTFLPEIKRSQLHHALAPKSEKVSIMLLSARAKSTPKTSWATPLSFKHRDTGLLRKSNGGEPKSTHRRRMNLHPLHFAAKPCTNELCELK